MQDVRRLPELVIPESKTVARTDVLVGVLLVLVMVVGGYFRYVGINWDDFTHLHPDERFMTDVVQGLGNQLNPSGGTVVAQAQVTECVRRYPDTKGIGPYFDSLCSTLNPINANSGHGLYVYGTLPLFITKAAGALMVEGSEWVARNILATRDVKYANYDGSQWATYDGIQLVWRFLSALSEMIVILIVFIIGTKLHDKWIGLLAAFFYSVTVFSIQMSHFGTVDAMANLFTALTILFAVQVQRQGKLRDYAWFGIFFGCTVASRINLAPLAALIVIAALMQVIPIFDSRVAPGERNRQMAYHTIGLVLAGFLSLLVFRIFNPYAFNGPGFFGLSLDQRWLSNISAAQAMNSGVYDNPPNFQWVARLPYLFPLNTMILWGMGLPLGIMAWVSWLWSGIRIIRSKRAASQNVLLVVWVLIYFGWLGRNWVTTQRYFLPIYPVLMILAAWGLVWLVRYAKDHLWRRRVFRLLLVGVAVFALLWSAMFTNIYRHLLTRVQASYWVYEHVPGDFAMTVNDPSATSPIINIALPNNGLGDRRTYDTDNPGSEHQFKAPVTGKISAVYVNTMDDPQHDADSEALYFTITRLSDNVQMSDSIFTQDLTHADDSQLPQSYMIPFKEFTVEQDETYQLNVLLINGGPVVLGSFTIPIEPSTDSTTPLINIALPNNNYGASPDDLVSKVTRFDSLSNSMTVNFTAPADGTITSIYAPHLGDPNDDPAPEALRFTILRAGSMEILDTASLQANLVRDSKNILGRSYNIPLDKPLTVEKGGQYYFKVDLVSGGSVLSGGSVFTWEGAWDDPVPIGLCAMPAGMTVEDDPPPGLYMDRRDCKGYLGFWDGLVQGYQQNIVYEDEPAKRDRLLMTLDNSDYLAISSNRFYDTLSRNPMRWPLSNFYYQQLFAGQLGYDLIETFQESFQLGPLKVSDQYLPTYTGPKWLNEFESEEAFSVYDHPVVFIFQKRADYDVQKVHDLLNSVPLTRVGNSPTFANCPNTSSYYCDATIVNVATISSDQAAKTPTDLQLTPAMEQIQSSNGTWTERFDEQSIVNNNQPVAVVIWWMTLMVFGFAAYPLVFVLLPAFADRGYGFAKFAGMLLTGWATWYLASFRVPVWSEVGIAGALGALFLIGMALMWRKRDEFVDFLREHWKRLALIELITLIAFLVFLGVRLSNPDLWQPTFGGEKPMDFAYFNAVLRSTIFPPLDPWYAGGYINYYYFGYVIVGTPVLLLKMFPSIAYNLIVPTLFSLAGIAAFSVAFNLVHALRERIPNSDGDKVRRVRRLGNPWIAGIAALLLAVVLGNLDTPRQFLTGIARSGGYIQPVGMQDYLTQKYISEHKNTIPDNATMQQLAAEAADPSILDQISYEAGNSADLVVSLGKGLGRVLSGGTIGIGPERWFWGPTRILAETPGVEGYAINEMPIFTFVYGDMHAHMIAMPMSLAVMGLILNEVLLAGSTKRRRGLMLASVALLGIYVGMLRATNTWDWVTFMLLSVVGLVLAWWLGEVARNPKKGFWGRITRRSMIDFAVYIGGFVAFSFIAVMPYNAWFATAYTSISPWKDGKTPIWAYLDIHGLFLFLIVSLLVWETARWLRTVYVRALRGMWLALVAGLVVVAGLLLGALVLSLASYQVTLVVLPLLLWIAVLFLRSGQSRVMQFVLLLMGLALGLTLGVEYVVLDGDIGRQNTVFKFYLQAWLLFSVVGGAAFAWVVNGIWRWKPALRGVWMFILVLMVGAASLFPIMATRGKAAFRFDLNKCAPLTLDGMDYMKCAQQSEGSDEVKAVDPSLMTFPLSEDYAMIRWLENNVQGTPTIMEGLSDNPLYHWSNRISIYTGLPDVIGWNWHQKQQRSIDPFGRIVETRNSNVNAFYFTTSIGDAWDMIKYYNVSYVIVGGLERAYYHADGLAKFDQMVQEGLLTVVYQHDNSTIYQVVPDAKLVVQG